MTTLTYGLVLFDEIYKTAVRYPLGCPLHKRRLGLVLQLQMIDFWLGLVPGSWLWSQRAGPGFASQLSELVRDRLPALGRRCHSRHN